MLANINEETRKENVLKALDLANIVALDVLQNVENTDIIFKQVLYSLETILALAKRLKAF